MFDFFLSNTPLLSDPPFETMPGQTGTGNDDFFNGNAQRNGDVEAGAAKPAKKNIFKKIQDTDTKTVTTYLRYANLCNALCIITAGVVTLAAVRKSIS